MLLRFLLAAILALAPVAALAEQRPVNIGAPNSGTGDPLRAAFAKLNANDVELYASVSTLLTALAGKAPLASPALTGTPTVPTPSAGDNSTRIANAAYVNTAFATRQPLDLTLTRLSTLGVASLLDSGAVFGGHSVAAVLSRAETQAHPFDARGILAIRKEAFGSGVDGGGSVAVADFNTLFEIKKTNWLTSDQPGEVDTLSLITRQGRRGDAGSILFNGQKVKGTATDTGGLTGLEGELRWVNAAGAATMGIHVTTGHLEGVGGISGGTAVGFTAEATKGTPFAAFHAGAFNPDGDTLHPKWQYGYFQSDTRDPLTVSSSIDNLGLGYFKGGLRVGTGATIATLGNAAEKNTGTAAGTVAAGDDSRFSPGSWTQTTPVPLAAVGTITSASSVVRYRTFGKTVYFTVKVTIPTAGTGSNQLLVNMPYAAVEYSAFAGRENAVSGKMLQGFIAPGSATLNILTYDNLTTITNGAVVICSGVYEAT